MRVTDDHGFFAAILCGWGGEHASLSFVLAANNLVVWAGRRRADCLRISEQRRLANKKWASKTRHVSPYGNANEVKKWRGFAHKCARPGCLWSQQNNDKLIAGAHSLFICFYTSA